MSMKHGDIYVKYYYGPSPPHFWVDGIARKKSKSYLPCHYEIPVEEFGDPNSGKNAFVVYEYYFDVPLKILGVCWGFDEAAKFRDSTECEYIYAFEISSDGEVTEVEDL